MIAHLHVSLPFPPPVNNLFLNLKRGGRAATPRYLAWQVEAALALRGCGRILGCFEATLQFQRPSRARRDLDGLAKAPLDALVKAGVLTDDSLAQRITLEWAPGDPTPDARVSIWLVPVADPDALTHARAA